MSKPRILVVRGGAIGDFIVTLPALEALRQQWPEAHLEILGYPHITQLAQGRYYANATRSIDARPMSGFFIPDAVLDPDLANYFGSFALVISYLYDPDQVFSSNVRRCGPRQVIEASPRPTDLPAAEHYCKPLESLAMFVDNPTPKFFPNAADKRFAEELLIGNNDRKRVAVHPGSGSPKKNWSVEKFAAVSRWLVDELNVDLSVVQGEADEETVARFGIELGPRPFRLLRGLRLPELGAVLARMDTYIGNDTGITHLAAAAGCSTLALFGPNSQPAIWAPRGKEVRLVEFGANDLQQVRQVAAEWLGRASC